LGYNSVAVFVIITKKGPIKLEFVIITKSYEADKWANTRSTWK
jgi:hypothetical protein